MKYEEVEVNSERWFDLAPLLNEEFRDIVGYEGLYQISNYGRVKSLKIRNSVNIHNQTKILKQCESKFGYYIVNLSNKSQRVHRLVALTFIPNLENYYCVNHIDGNKHNNKVDNLEWCTSSYNNYEAYRLGLRQGGFKNKFGKNCPRKVNIICMYDLEQNFLEKFYGTGEIKRKYGYSPTSINQCCKNIYNSAYGYLWAYEGNKPQEFNKSYKSRNRKNYGK